MAKSNSNGALKELTGPQLASAPADDGKLARTGLPTYKRMRELRVDPTIALARMLVVAPAVAAGWTTEGRDDVEQEMVDFIDEQLQSKRIHILRTALYAHVDYGWIGYEKVLSVNAEGKIIIPKLKPLYHDITTILVDKATGAFAGLHQQPDIILPVENCLLISIDVEGTNWYGQPLLENSRKAVERWDKVELAAARYDDKIAGSHWKVMYPEGMSDFNGTLTDNYEIAKQILATLQSSGGVVMPSGFHIAKDDLEAGDTPPGVGEGWDIDILTDGSSGRSGFTERQKYLDALKVRGLGIPERAVLEGQFGTKAEAEAHADFAITNVEQRHEVVVQHLNWHVVNQLLRLNFGPEFENKVWLAPQPLSDQKRAILKSLYTTLLTTPEGFVEEFDSIDTAAMREALGVPSKVMQAADASAADSNTATGLGVL